MEKRMKYMIHKTLESGRSITQSKGHYQEFMMTLTSAKCSLGNVFLFHTKLVVDRT
jgi:flagellar biosynthesis chaperone FliJ